MYSGIEEEQRIHEQRKQESILRRFCTMSIFTLY